MRIGIGCNCICSVCVQLRVRVFYYLLIDFWRKLTSTVMVWVRCYESIYYSLKWKFKKSNSITNDKYLANSEMIWAFVQFQTNEFRLKKMSLIYENSSSFDMKKKSECDIHKQKLIIVDLSVKLLQWISRDTSMLTIPNLNTKLSGWNQLYHTRSFYISFLQLLIIKFQILIIFGNVFVPANHTKTSMPCSIGPRSVGSLILAQTGRTSSITLFWCVFFVGGFWFNLCVLVNCIYVLVKNIKKHI